MCCPPNTVHCGDTQLQWQKLRAISPNFTAVRLQKMLPLHLLLWNRLIALESLRAKNLEAPLRAPADAVAWIVCRLLFIAALKRAERKEQHSSAARYQVSVWNWTCALTRGPVALIMFCPSLLLSGFKFTNSTIAIWSSHLSTLRAQWVSGIIGYMAWFTYLNFGPCAACLRLSPTTCYSFVLPTRDIPLLIEIEWKALPWRLHLAAFSKESVSHVLCSQLTWCRNHEII